MNPANGKEASSSKGEHEYLYQDPNRVVYHALLYHVVVPGVGVVLIDAGYITFTSEQSGDPSQWTSHGNHQFYEEGDLANCVQCCNSRR